MVEKRQLNFTKIQNPNQVFFEIYKSIQISLLCIRSRQKEFSLYIEEAKQEKTKHSRLEKIIPLIFKGVGLNDKYKK